MLMINGRRKAAQLAHSDRLLKSKIFKFTYAIEAHSTIFNMWTVFIVVVQEI